jgi:hypothetical protein
LDAPAAPAKIQEVLLARRSDQQRLQYFHPAAVILGVVEHRGDPHRSRIAPSAPPLTASDERRG